MIQRTFMKPFYFIVVVGVILVILSGSRILWVNAFHNLSHSAIENGQLTLQDWQAEENEILLLDGQWEFFPLQWLMNSEQSINKDEETKQLVQVPGRWNEHLHEGQSTPYGYGSYRLRIYVNPNKNLNYSIYVPSIRSSSEVYINGRYLTGSGQVGTTEAEYIAKNLPYSATFTADDHGLIEIVIQAANFKDIRQSGIIRSIKFGSEAAISKERSLSLSMQVLERIRYKCCSLPIRFNYCCQLLCLDLV